MLFMRRRYEKINRKSGEKGISVVSAGKGSRYISRTTKTSKEVKVVSKQSSLQSILTNYAYYSYKGLPIAVLSNSAIRNAVIGYDYRFLQQEIDILSLNQRSLAMSLNKYSNYLHNAGYFQMPKRKCESACRMNYIESQIDKLIEQTSS